jgi:hypothetical protein
VLYCSARCFLLECSSSSLTHPKTLKKKLQNEIMRSKAKQSKTNQKLKEIMIQVKVKESKEKQLMRRTRTIIGYRTYVEETFNL